VIDQRRGKPGEATRGRPYNHKVWDRDGAGLGADSNIDSEGIPRSCSVQFNVHNHHSSDFHTVYAPLPHHTSSPIA
jgi:hypothetical protein